MSIAYFTVLLPVAVAWACGYYIGRSSMSDKRDIQWVDAKIRAYVTAEASDTDEAWDVYEAAFPPCLHERA